MVEVRRFIAAEAQKVFDVLSDGWQYANWVVGAAHIRAVDRGWPAAGSRIHHRIGAWPVQMADVTRVLKLDAPALLELEAEVRPLGTAWVKMELSPVDGGTEVRMTERIVHGPMAAIPIGVQALLLKPRNAESLSRLADLVQGRIALADAATAAPGQSGVS